MPQINTTIAQAVARRISLQPLLAVPEASMDIDLGRFLALTPEERADEEALYATWKAEVVAAYGMQPEINEKPYAFAGGVAVIPIHGMLINRFGGSWGWVTGYQYISKMSMMADADPDVQLIVYDINSGGGEVSGCAEAGAIIAAMETPTMGIIDSRCYSAAYWLGSQVDKLVSTPSGGAGSVGAMTMHIDVSELMDSIGMKVTLMYAGKHKVDGNQFEKLDPDVKEKTEARLEEIRQDFAETVAEGRGITLESVLATEADCYTAEQAVELKLIDAINDPSAEILTAMSRMADGYDPFDENDDEEDDMSNAAKVTNKPTTEAQAEAPVDAKTIELESRARMKAINTHANASAQSDLASFLAYDTDLSSEMCCAILDKVTAPAAPAPVEKAETDPTKNGTKAENDGSNTFAKAMEDTKNPEIKPNQEKASEENRMADILALIPDEMKTA
jgi:ClpP class serine protease